MSDVKRLEEGHELHLDFEKLRKVGQAREAVLPVAVQDAATKEVLVIADGAVWIWNLVEDRFAGARQRLDPWHALQHLWAVAHALHPTDDAGAAAWIKPLQDKLLESKNVASDGSFKFVSFLYDWGRIASFAPPIAFGGRSSCPR